MKPLSRGPQFVISMLLTIIGVGLAAYGGVMAIEGMNGTGAETRLDTTGIVTFAGGAVCFAVGAMWLLVVMVRPFFGKRAIDRYADDVAAEKRLRPGG